MAPAQAVTGQTGNGYASNTTVLSTLTVPQGGEWRLDRVTINGDVVVSKDASLVILSSTVNGSIRAGEVDSSGHRGGYLNSWNSIVTGDVTLSNIWGADVSQSRVGGQVRSGWTAICGHGECSSDDTIFVGDGTRLGGLGINRQKVVIRNATVEGATTVYGGTMDADRLASGSVDASNTASRWTPPLEVILGGSTVSGATTLSTPFAGGPLVLGSADGKVTPNNLGTLTVRIGYFRPQVEVVGNTSTESPPGRRRETPAPSSGPSEIIGSSGALRACSPGNPSRPRP